MTTSSSSDAIHEVERPTTGATSKPLTGDEAGGEAVPLELLRGRRRALPEI